MRFGIRQKLFVLLGVLVSITQKMTEAIQQKVKFDFEQRQRVFQREQALKYSLLETQAVLIGENATLKVMCRSTILPPYITSSTSFRLSLSTIFSSSPTEKEKCWPVSASRRAMVMI